MIIISSFESISGKPIGESIRKNGKNNDADRWNDKLRISLFDHLQNYNKRSVPVYFLDDNAAYNTKRDNEPTLKGKFKNCYFSIVQCIIPSWLRRK
uniref:Transposase n=1 Tax=Romanomermis culicivorax TaxID=13658 RepID=A0A915ILW3_ROMCU